MHMDSEGGSRARDPAIVAVEAFRNANAALEARRAALEAAGLSEDEVENSDETEFRARGEALNQAYLAEATTTTGLVSQLDVWLAEDADGVTEGADGAAKGALALLRSARAIVSGLADGASTARRVALDLEPPLAAALDLTEVLFALPTRGALQDGLEREECRGLARVADEQRYRLEEVKTLWQALFDAS